MRLLRVYRSGVCANLLALVLLAAMAQPLAARAGSTPAAVRSAEPSAPVVIEPELDAGLRLLYGLKFEEARTRINGWQENHPADSVGPALEAAADLFEQLYLKGVLTSEFFLDDKRFLSGIRDQPDAKLESAFLSAADRAEERARQTLSAQPRDADALFALTLVSGMRADNASLIEKRQLESMRYLRESSRNAQELLKVAPDTADAYLALGAAHYLVGCLPGYKRFLLGLGGVHGDKALGIQQLTLAANSGHYLRPYAKLLLALSALREKNPELARTEFTQLVAEFPGNPLYARELAKLTTKAEGSTPAVPFTLVQH
jgi:hypothetical protein